ncbi:MAG: GNAT family N-acetyltransferase [Myxococcales bacterium]|nr:GNAT family N-acetyltransferase [Myxococcales bacterium]
MQPWTLERKRDACLRGRFGPDLVRGDTRVTERPGWYQTLTPSTSGTCNEVVISQVSERDAERVIDETVAAYRAYGLATKWFVGYWTEPADFGERLERRGFKSSEVRGMGCPASLELGSPSDITVRQLEVADLDAHLSVVMQGWGVPASEFAVWREVYAARMQASPRTVFYFEALRGGEVVGTASLVLRGDSGYLMGAQVIEHARGHGVYRALLAQRLAFLRERRIEYATTQALEATSAPRLEYLGFETLFRYKAYLLEP